MKKLGIGILGVLAFLFLLIAFLPKNYSVSRSITIQKPKSEVFDYLKLLKNQDNFSKWAKMDPYMTKEFRGEDGKVGFISIWESKNDDVGKGEQEIIAIQDGEKIEYELRFQKPFESTSKAYFLIESESEYTTKVTWGIEGKMSYPMNALLLVMNFDKMVGDDFEEGLLNLQKILDSNQ
jgi:uncharacterized protein YndB with AHSA1/START domain